LYYSPHVIGIVGLKRVRCVEHEACCGDKNSYRVVLQIPEGKRALGMLWLRWGDIKIGLQKAV